MYQELGEEIEGDKDVLIEEVGEFCCEEEGEISWNISEISSNGMIVVLVIVGRKNWNREEEFCVECW